MTQDINTTYKRYLDRPEKIPVYIVEFDGITTRYSDHEIVNATGPYEVYVQEVQGAGSQITVVEGRSSIGNINFKMIDKDKEITKLVYQYSLLNRKVTVKTGFLDMDEADYVKVFIGKVLNYQLLSDNVSYRFNLVTLWKSAKVNIMTAITRTSLSVGIGDATINVVNAANFATATGTQFYIKIDNEVILYTGKTGTSFTGCSRGQLGTAPATHASSAEVVNFVVLQNNAIDIALQILTSTGLGTNGTHDVLPASCGLAIDQNDIAITKMETERDRWLRNITFKFEFEEAQEGKKFLESEIFRFINAYPIVDNEGRISVKVYKPPLPTIDIREFNDDNLVGAPVWQGQIMDTLFFNEIDLSYDWDFATGQYLSRSLYEDTNSQTKYSEVKTLKIESKGLRTGVISQPKIDNIALRIFKRFANPAPQLTAKTFFSERITEPGDIVRLTSDKIPDMTRGEMGVSNKMVEAVKVDFDYVRGSEIFRLIDTEFSYGKKYGAISPSTKPPINFPNWNVASATQRLYCFISRWVNATTGVMSDGSDGYYITP